VILRLPQASPPVVRRQGLAPGPNGVGKNDKIKVPLSKDYLPSILGQTVTVDGNKVPVDYPDFYSYDIPNNRYEFSNKELNDDAWFELSIAGGEMGGELVGPTITWGKICFKVLRNLEMQD
jgi:hypothetical protein